MSYEELEKNCEKNWTTEGPNSGGVSGYFLYQGMLYPWTVEWGCDPSLGSPLSVQNFISIYKDTANPRTLTVVSDLSRLGYLS